MSKTADSLEKGQAAPETAKASRAQTAKKAALWISGVTPTKMLAQEAKSTGQITIWMLKNIFQMVKMNSGEAKADKAKASASPEEFWDEVVETAGITEETLHKKYQLATWGSYACLFAMSISIGILSVYQGAAAITVGNIVLINILLILYINNQHKLYTAKNQRIITIPRFIKECLSEPGNLLPSPLPGNYQLRKVKPKNNGAGK